MTPNENAKNKKAFITGITGQDGSYLTEFLLNKNYEIHGLVRRTSSFNRGRIEHLYQDPHTTKRVFLHYGDLTDSASIYRLINQIKPDEVYHLGAQSHVRISFDMPEYTADTDALGTIRILEAIRSSGLPIKFYMASSSEMFGNSPPPQNEKTPFNPQSPYAISKIFSYYATRFYREAYGIFASNGILFNHESERRGENFVTRKITLGIAKIKLGLMEKIYLGNLEAKRDWGYAPEFMEAIYKIMQHPRADDFVVATGQTHSIKEFLAAAFEYAGLGSWEKYVEFDPRYLRPADVNALVGSAAKAKEKLNWEPQIKFLELVKIMIDADFKKFGLTPLGEGEKILKEKFPNRWWKFN